MTLKARLEKLEANNSAGLHIVAGCNEADFKSEIATLTRQAGKAPSGLIICVRHFCEDAA